MSEAGMGWFHCGRCGALFEARTGDDEPATCGECGRPAVVAESELAFHRAASEKSSGRRSGSDGSRRSHGHGDGSPHRRSHRGSGAKRNGLMSFAIGWILVLLVIAGIAVFRRGGEATADRGNTDFAVADRNQRLLSGHLPACVARLESFLAAAAPEARITEVMSSTTLGEMTRFYARHPMVVVPTPDYELELAGVLDTPEGPAIEGVWREKSDGRLFEAVFFPEADDPDDWRIDWKAFVRHSPESWRLFLSGGGPDEAEFRLLARRRAADVGLEGTVEKLILAAPVVGDPGRAGLSSPEIEVDPESRNGRILTSAFEERAEGRGAYGSRAQEFDPSQMIRVRLKLIRSGEGEEVRFEVQDVIACHWLHFDELGLGK